MPQPRGHLILKEIAASEGFATLAPKAAVLFTMLIPHFDNHGKMLANPYLIKGQVCPKVHYLTVDVIERALGQIGRQTNVKYYSQDGIWYLHALRFGEHQNIRKDRKGADLLPDFPGDALPEPSQATRRSTPGVVQEYSETQGLDDAWDEMVSVFTEPGQKQISAGERA